MSTILNWLDDLLPEFCAVCKRLVMKKNAKCRVHRLAGRIWMCRKCYKLYYEPWK